MTVVKNRFRSVKVGSRGGTFSARTPTPESARASAPRTRTRPGAWSTPKTKTISQPQINRRMGAGAPLHHQPRRGHPHLAVRHGRYHQGQGRPHPQTLPHRPQRTAYRLIEAKVLVETQAADFLEVLRAGTVSTNVSSAVFRITPWTWIGCPSGSCPSGCFPKVAYKDQRGISRDEHQQILEREGNPERRDFYELCWYFGGSPDSDIASLQAGDLDYKRRGFSYERLKTSSLSGCRIGSKAWKVILRRPRQAPLFPYLINIREGHRSTGIQTALRGVAASVHRRDAALLPVCLGRALRQQRLPRTLRPARAQGRIRK